MFEGGFKTCIESPSSITDIVKQLSVTTIKTINNQAAKDRLTGLPRRKCFRNTGQYIID